MAPVEKMILDGTRRKQSFRFADTHVSLLFEDVPERRNFIPKELSRFQGYEDLMSVANTNSEFSDILVIYEFYVLPLSMKNTQNTQRIMANLCIQRSYQTIPFELLNSLRKLLLNIIVIIFLTPPQSGDDNPSHDMPGAGAVTTDPSQSVERGIHDNSNRPSNNEMVENLPGGVTEPTTSLFHLTCLLQSPPKQRVYTLRKSHTMVKLQIIGVQFKVAQSS
ncbi:unnamed protein product [Eruca vesicaria subsp. sativa]|uniref:Uncharacterized protein n=1 Tax=Eruca vesicaria subsp. sativa TaxID=29727 RepID=A0ABC8LSR7_ERUVS|nr:unnamed protein product [Eruca vesicaria subsp. sativa]